MSDFSIDLAAERIYDRKTKEYFREVMSSFANGNHRSAVVMLWTVVVCDLVYKLQDLRDVHQDAVARDILKEVENLQQANPTSSEWERRLLDRVRGRTKLLDAGEALGLEQIQALRHLCAHPILRSEELLFRPNRETVRAHIRNALEGLLTKPPIYTREPVNEFVSDLADKRDLLPDDSTLERYIRAKYLPRLVPEVEDRLFRTLWKFVFNLANPDADANREINHRALSLLFRRRTADLLVKIAAERDYFSTISAGVPSAYLVRFVGQHPQVYELLSDAARLPIARQAEADLDMYLVAWFLHGDVAAHVEAVEQRFLGSDWMDWEMPSREAWAGFVNLSRESGLVSNAIMVGVRLYGHSFSFDDADERFATFVEPFLDEMDDQHLTVLLEVSQANGETTSRRRSRRDHSLVVAAVRRVLGLTFDLGPYRHFATLKATS